MSRPYPVSYLCRRQITPVHSHRLIPSCVLFAILGLGDFKYVWVSGVVATVFSRFYHNVSVDFVNISSLYQPLYRAVK